MAEKIQSYFDIDPQLFKERQKKTRLTIVNIANLNGIQPLSEYSVSKGEKIEELYKSYANMGNVAQLTRDFPVTCCAVPSMVVSDPDFELALTELTQDAGYYLAIIDGHHRVRYGPKFGVTDFYCSVFSLSQTLLHLKKNRKLASSVSPEGYYKMLIHGMSTTIESFSQHGYTHSMVPIKL